MEYRVVTSRTDFPESWLKFLKNAPLFLQPDYLAALEAGKTPGLTFRYVMAEEKGRPVAFYNYQLVALSQRSIHRIFYRQKYSRILARFSAMMTRYLFGVKEGQPHYLLINGSVMISGPYYGWAPDLSKMHLLLNGAIKQVSDSLNRDGKIIATVIKDFEMKSDFHPPSGYNRVMMDPVMEFKIDPQWNSMDDYLTALSAKYRLRYNNALKKMKGLELRVLSLEEIKEQQEVINRLYQNVQNRAPIRLVQPDSQYLEAVHGMHHPDAFLKAWYLEGEMVMFMCGVSHAGHLEAHHIGMDYNLNKSRHLYLNLLYEFIREGIGRKATRISFGRTALEIKSTVGAEPVYFNAWLKMGNTFLNRLMRPFIPAAPADDWIRRNPYREETSPNS